MSSRKVQEIEQKTHVLIWFWVMLWCSGARVSLTFEYAMHSKLDFPNDRLNRKKFNHLKIAPINKMIYGTLKFTTTHTILRARMSSWYFKKVQFWLSGNFLKVIFWFTSKPNQAKKTSPIIFQILCVLQKSFDNPKQCKNKQQHTQKNLLQKRSGHKNE